jgi:pantoate--beta-alanine ligase
MRVTPGILEQRLCGVSRPQFFGGIATVVMKFFNLIRPDKAYFGKKDFQQLTIIQRMAEQFYMDVAVIGCETVREPDGLAMSSRNARLKPHQRDLALTLHRMLKEAHTAYRSGERDARALTKRLTAAWPEGIELDYLEFREPRHLNKVDVLAPCTRLFLGAWLDGVRLIDNAAVGEDPGVNRGKTC